MKVACFVNPRGNRARREAVGVLRRELDGHEMRLGPYPSADVLVAVGGDGTVNRALSHLAGGARPLGVVPSGTANDLANAMGIPRHARAACALILRGRPVARDLLVVNGAPFATSGALGIAATTSARANAWKRSRRTCAGVYTLASLVEILRGTPPLRLRIAHDRGTIEGRFAGLFACNQARLGGRLTAAPGADPIDGRLDLVLIPDSGRLGLMIAAFRMRCGRPRLPTLRTRKAVIVTDRETTFFGDGEPLARGRTFRIEVRPGALRVLAPGR